MKNDVKNIKKGGKLSPAREIAYISLETALLLGVQFIFSALIGVEAVTLLLAAFSFSFGARRGILSAVAFTFLRCAVYGFYLPAVILYLIYYPVLALVFGFLGRVNDDRFARMPALPAIALNLALALFCTACALGARAASNGEISSRTAVKALLWTAFALGVAGVVISDVLLILSRFKKGCGAAVRLAAVCAAGALCTVLFTLLDDVISPLMLGLDKTAAAGYFYASLPVLAPQTVCVIATFAILFYPVTCAFDRVKKL